MVIECSSCQARFKLADDKIRENGTKVRCTKCREVFTVFPENQEKDRAPLAVSPLINEEANPVPPPPQPSSNVVADDFFSSSEEAVSSSSPSPDFSFPQSTHVDWDQKADSISFANSISYDAENSDLDAINFDDIKAPVFSVASQQDENFEFNDETAFSFSESSLNDDSLVLDKRVDGDQEAMVDSAFNEGLESDFSFDPPVQGVSDHLNQSGHTIESLPPSFAETDNFDDFSWGDDNADTALPAVFENEQEKQVHPHEDTPFDFSSFSFDETPAVVHGEEGAADMGMETNSASLDLDIQPEPEESSEGSYQAVASLELESPVPAVSIDTEGQRQDHLSLSPPPHKSRPQSDFHPKKRSHRGGAVKIALLTLTLLTAGYTFLNYEQLQSDIRGFVDNFIEKKVSVENSGRIGLANLRGSFVLNSQEGNLFVIRGDAVNEFSGLRSSVLVKGVIYGENGEIIQGQSAYCGNPLSDAALKKLNFKEILEAMNNELGENLVNLNIAAGKSLPCTIVFHKFSGNIKEFTVEVLESKSGSK